MEKLKLSYIATGKNVKWYNFGNLPGCSSKSQTVITWPSNSTPKCIPKRKKTRIHMKYCVWIFTAASLTGKNKRKCDVHRLMSGWTRCRQIHTQQMAFSGISFSNIREWVVDRCYLKNLKNSAPSEQTQSQKISYDSIYVKCPDRQI